MTLAYTVALLNTVLGTVYTCYGLITIVDMKRGWKTNGFSHFGAAWVAMAFTCGPHHLDHGLHGFLSGRAGGWLDLLTIAVGFPAGVLWFLLRVEAMFGGRGDRHVTGTPVWLELLPAVFAGYSAAVVAAAIHLSSTSSVFVPRITPNLCLVALYSAVGVVLLRNQIRNHRVTGGWSASGLSLSMVMYTCAVMHGVFAVYANSGVYDLDWHGLVIDILAVPAACYFLWVTVSLTQGWMHDWNDAPDVARHEGGSSDVDDLALV